MMRLIRKHSDYAHIRIPICIRMYPNIFADADIKLHMYPIPKSAWEKIRMANSNELLCANRCRLGREGGDGNTHKTTCSYHFYQIISLWDAALRWEENLSSLLHFQLLEIFIWRHRLNWKSANFQFLHRSCENRTYFRPVRIIIGDFSVLSVSSCIFHCRLGYHKIFTSIYYDSVSPESVSAGWPSCK